MEDTILLRLNDNVEKMNAKIDDQGGTMREIVVKLDFYGDTQKDHTRRITVVEEKASALTSIEERLKKVEKAIAWVSSTVIGAVIVAIITFLFTKK